MDSHHAVVLGIVQGLTEFLPVSSSAHLVLFPYFLRWEDPGLAFDVALHMGTLGAILAFFWRDWIVMGKQLLGYAVPSYRAIKSDVSIWLLVIGSVPAAIAGLLFKGVAEETLRSPWLGAMMLILFGAVLWYYDARGRKDRAVESFRPMDAALVGLAQALAIIPGVSRSGITITAALALGLTRPAAARFSFLLSAPIIAGAGLVESKYIAQAIYAGGETAANVGWGFAASLISGLFAVGLLTYMIKTRSYAVFSIYRFVLGFAVIVGSLLAGRG